MDQLLVVQYVSMMIVIIFIGTGILIWHSSRSKTPRQQLEELENLLAANRAALACYRPRLSPEVTQEYRIFLDFVRLSEEEAVIQNKIKQLKERFPQLQESTSFGFPTSSLHAESEDPFKNSK